MLRILPILLLAASAWTQSDATTSKAPPKGPPWLRSFSEARKLAIEKSRPIFVYSTKTY